MLNGCNEACSLVQSSLKDDSSNSTHNAEIFYDFWDLIVIETFLYIFGRMKDYLALKNWVRFFSDGKQTILHCKIGPEYFERQTNLVM